MRKKTIQKAGLIFALVLGGASFGSCIWEEIPYEDENGIAKFPFYNACDKDFTVSLCVKGVASGTDRIVFNRFSGRAPKRGLLTLSGGSWKEFQNYHWVVGDEIECPFER